MAVTKGNGSADILTRTDLNARKFTPVFLRPGHPDALTLTPNVRMSMGSEFPGGKVSRQVGRVRMYLLRKETAVRQGCW